MVRIIIENVNFYLQLNVISNYIIKLFYNEKLYRKYGIVQVMFIFFNQILDIYFLKKICKYDSYVIFCEIFLFKIIKIMKL